MIMYEKPEVFRTLDLDFMTGYLKQAQWAEFIELKKIINEVAKRKGSPIDVLDIGIGDARIPITLAEIEEVWKCIGRFDGIDISDDVLRAAKDNVKKHNLSDKVNIRKFDAKNLNQLLDLEQRYDLIISTYFTAGNFFPDSFSFDENIDSLDYSEIKSVFQNVFKPAFNLLRSSGELILGSVYIDNTISALRQKQFYEKCGMTVINKIAPFTATKEGFWSFRFTEEKVREFFDWIDTDKIKIIPLDTYNFAMMVRINKTSL
jgi:tRNA1(Val) A37 N6-methylase TrmN6